MVSFTFSPSPVIAVIFSYCRTEDYQPHSDQECISFTIHLTFLEHILKIIFLALLKTKPPLRFFPHLHQWPKWGISLYNTFRSWFSFHMGVKSGVTPLKSTQLYHYKTHVWEKPAPPSPLLRNKQCSYLLCDSRSPNHHDTKSANIYDY